MVRRLTGKPITREKDTVVASHRQPITPKKDTVVISQTAHNKPENKRKDAVVSVLHRQPHSLDDPLTSINIPRK